MVGFKGPAQPSLTLRDALNAGYGYLEVLRPTKISASDPPLYWWPGER